MREQPLFRLPRRRFVLCDSCGRRRTSDTVRVVDRRVICSKCRRDGSK